LIQPIWLISSSSGTISTSVGSIRVSRTNPNRKFLNGKLNFAKPYPASGLKIISTPPLTTTTIRVLRNACTIGTFANIPVQLRSVACAGLKPSGSSRMLTPGLSDEVTIQ
jgi:hypothetical protein